MIDYVKNYFLCHVIVCMIDYIPLFIQEHDINSTARGYQLLKASRSYFSIVLTAIISLCTSCSDSTGMIDSIYYRDFEAENTYCGSGNGIFHIETDDNVNLTYTLDLGENTRDVYFLFTNTSLSEPAVMKSISADFDKTNHTYNAVLPDCSNKNHTSYNDTALLRGKPEISEYNKNPLAHNDTASPFSRSLTSPEGPLYKSSSFDR